MKKNTRILFIAFGLLGSLAAWMILSKPGKSSSKVSWDQDFRIEEVSEIERIFLADRLGNSTTLVKKAEGHWIYNDKYRANQNVVDNILQAARNVEVKFRPNAEATQNIIKDLATIGIKAEFYDSQGKLLKSYIVGGTTPDERGTYMIMEDAEQPYVTHISMLEGGLRVRYNIFGDWWRDKTVFGMSPDSIASVSIEYPKQKNESFSLQKTPEGYTVNPLFEVTPVAGKQPSPGRVKEYLSGYERVIAEAFENQNPHRDSIINSRLPFSIIKVRLENGSEKEVTLYPVGVRKALPGEPAPAVERYLATVKPEGDFMLVQDLVIRKLFRPYSYFFE